MASRSRSNAGARKLTPAQLSRLHIKEFALRQLAGRLNRVEIEWSRCVQTPGADEIHDLRVSLRRFGETLWLFRRLFPKRERKQVRAELKTVLGYAGETRDVDIAFESFEEAGIILSPELRLHLESQRAIGEAALVATLAVGRRTHVIERWRRALALEPELRHIEAVGDGEPVEKANSHRRQTRKRAAKRPARGGDKEAHASEMAPETTSVAEATEELSYENDVEEPSKTNLADADSTGTESLTDEAPVAVTGRGD